MSTNTLISESDSPEFAAELIRRLIHNLAPQYVDVDPDEACKTLGALLEGGAIERVDFDAIHEVLSTEEDANQMVRTAEREEARKKLVAIARLIGETFALVEE